MGRNRPELFKGRHFEAEIIVLCARWYLRYPLSLRQLQEINGRAEPQRGLCHHLALVFSATPRRGRKSARRLERETIEWIASKTTPMSAILVQFQSALRLPPQGQPWLDTPAMLGQPTDAWSQAEGTGSRGSDLQAVAFAGHQRVQDRGQENRQK